MLLYLREQSNMSMHLRSQRHDRQVDQPKRLQQGFRRRTAGGALGIARIQARQALLLLGQALPTAPLQQRQQAQGQREQVNEPGDGPIPAGRSTGTPG